MQMRRLRNSLIASSFVIVLAMGCATKPDDAQLATNLKAQMFSDPQTKNADLQVAVKNGVVTLSGAVPSDAARLEAYKLATNTPGVSKVNDQMTVQAPVQTAEAMPAPAAPPMAEAPRRSVSKRTRERVRPVHKKHPTRATAESAKASSHPVASPTPTPEPVAASATAPAAPQQAAPAATPQAAPPPPPQPVTAIFPAGTTVEIQTVDAIDSKTAQAGDEFQATLAQPLTWDSRVIVPKGANVYLRLVAAETSGQYKGRSELQLALARLEFQGKQYRLESTTYTQTGSSRGKDTAKTVGGGAIVGAIIGAIAGGGKGAAIGGAAGAGAGGVFQGVTKAKQVRIPAETTLDFKLDKSLNIPVPAQSGTQ